MKLLALAALGFGTVSCATAPQAPSRPPVFIPPPKPAPRPATTRPDLPSAATQAPAAMMEGIKAIWANYPDRAGIAIVRADGSWTIEHRGGEMMPQQSVSKLWVAVTLMEGVDQGRYRLSDPVTVRKSDLVVFSTAMGGLVGATGFQTTLGALLKRAMTVSDNTANDVLMGHVGGPEAVRVMLSSKGLGAIRFGPGENLLQAGTAGLPWREEYREGKKFQAARALLSDAARRRAMDAYIASPPDGAAPLAIARALLRLKQGELLSQDSTRHILMLMESSETGKQRLKAGVPFGWTFAHKTGTGQDFQGRTAGYNDVSLMTAPDGTSYAVVVMIADASRPVPERMQVMQGISATVGANHRR